MYVTKVTQTSDAKNLVKKYNKRWTEKNELFNSFIYKSISYHSKMLRHENENIVVLN